MIGESDKTIFGFWVYLMTDLLMFAALFATFAVLRNNTFGGPPGKELFNLPYVFVETMILLTSSFTAGLGVIAAHHKKKSAVIALFGITLTLGLIFLGMELSEFSRLIADGNGFQRSGFLSSFFTLVGTHGLHITFGSLWMVILLIQIFRKGLTEGNVRKLTLLSLFWHFLDIVWIFIFTTVYLMGAIS
jgi:cytochrome o ubiquinol oxidase subunit III